MCVRTCLSKKRERELFVYVMLMPISCLLLIVHSADLGHDAVPDTPVLKCVQKKKSGPHLP